MKLDIGPLQPDLPAMLFGLALFAVITIVLGRVLFPRLERTLADRHDAIEGRLDYSEGLQAEAREIFAEYRRVLNEAHHEAARIRQGAAEEGAALVAAARAEGLAEREALVTAARATLAVDRELAELELRADVGMLAVELAGRVVGEPLGEFADRRDSVERFFAEH
ncbi:F-type H+-transporting ATPase subunit b [Kitasatospora gansuensis]|uniref:ATP synthase subunit b n=1 Tax=Kitasatospora gansuensis TaxID=258050 RepID=A0A7W7SI51_9ACTN|nr:ATP synthase F0 subunit B [Kitasatospora gansuensis]MBB4949721.1 F-type H+-transporting ATPase subunit b [Kitasatospora gansuensis]